MPKTDITAVSKEVLANADPSGTSEYLIYMLVLFMVLLVVAALVAFFMWLKFHKSAPAMSHVTPVNPTLEGLKLDMEQSLMLNQHSGQIGDLVEKIEQNTKNANRISEAVGQLVQVTEVQGNRMLQHDAILQQLYTLSSKQNEIISKFHGE